VRHVTADMKRLRAEGFDIVVHTFSENDLAFYRGTMSDIVQATSGSGMRAWLDPWGVGGIFGGEAFSRAALQRDWCQVAGDGARLPACCPNHPGFRGLVLEWIEAACATAADAVFWDEPHFYVDHKRGAEGCCCEHCRAAGVTREMSLIRFLQWACSEVTQRDKSNVICVLPPAAGRPQPDEVAKLEGLSNLGTVPFWALHDAEPESYMTEVGRPVVERARAAGLESHLWIQGFRIPAEREHEITRAVAAAGSLGPDVIAIWGFDGCASMSSLSCARPTEAWKAFLDGMTALSESGQRGTRR